MKTTYLPLPLAGEGQGKGGAFGFPLTLILSPVGGEETFGSYFLTGFLCLGSFSIVPRIRNRSVTSLELS